MGRRVFVDTNVLVYLFDQSEPKKREAARQLLLDEALDLVISAQVLNEFYVTVTRKIAQPLTQEQASEALSGLAELEVTPLTRNLVVDAVRTGQLHQLSHRDALILESASRSGAGELFTEDLSTGATLRGVTIVNPFL